MVFRATMISSLVVFLAAGMNQDMWGPADGVQALAAVEKALDRVLSAPMSPGEKAKAAHVADDVRKAFALVENPKSNLTKAERKTVMGKAVQELLAIQSDLKGAEKSAEKQDAINAKVATLQQELAQKKAELQKDEAMIKLYTLQKALNEKKLQLQKLIERKNQGENSKAAVAEDARQERTIVAKLEKDAGALTKGGDLSPALKSDLAEVQAQVKHESASLTRMDAENKKTMSALDAEMKKSPPTKGKDDALNKGMSMIRTLKKEEHRHYLKARAQKQAQLSELKAAEQSLEQRDGTKLTTALAKISRQLDAESGKFLH